jgi:serine phosphatase RsbU (regulator of sigma subunit)
MLNDIVRRKAQSNAAEILESLKAAFVRSFVFDEEQYFLDGMDVALAIIDRDSMTIDYAGAKRPLIIVRNGTLHEYKPDKISIGHNPTRNDETFTDHKIEIQKGDMVYAFSDGISDQFGHEDGITKFGSRQLQNILTEMSFFDLPAQKKIIESSVDNWRIGAFLAGLTEIKAPQLDDQLLIGIRI